ncbi:hypothetical protein [Pyruvatibacter mobilis]|nr:hypothetical protein [Pyruvatibacter mobilis]
MANRSRVKMSQQIFERLITHASENGVVIPSPEQARWIRRLNDADASLMAKADVLEHQQITRQIRAIQFEHDAVRYFAVLGIGEAESLPDGLVPTELTPGTLTVVLEQSDIQPSAKGLEILEAIGGLHGGVDGFEGYELSDITRLYPSIDIFKADQNYEYTKNVVRVLGALTARSYVDGPIAPSGTTLNKVSEVFQSGPEHVPFESVLQGMLSISWGGFFLELYRAIEQLYAVPRLTTLVEAWPTSLPYRSLADLLESHLAWRPKEDDALAKIIAECDDTVVTPLRKSFSAHRDGEREITAEKVAADIYKVRNSLVHFRAALGTVQRTNEEWDDMISAMLGLVKDVYQRHGDRFNQELKA